MPTVLSPNTLMTEGKVAWGTHVSVAASDTIVTGLRKIQHVMVSLESDPALDPSWVSALPHASLDGRITIKSWKSTSATNPTPVAATVFSKRINWIAFGY